jgi:hypothetical protein
VFLVLAHDRGRILHFNVTAYPTAEWTGATSDSVTATNDGLPEKARFHLA